MDENLINEEEIANERGKSNEENGDLNKKNRARTDVGREGQKKKETRVGDTRHAHSASGGCICIRPHPFSNN